MLRNSIHKIQEDEDVKLSTQLNSTELNAISIPLLHLRRL